MNAIVETAFVIIRKAAHRQVAILAAEFMRTSDPEVLEAGKKMVALQDQMDSILKASKPQKSNEK
jgi:hypothetical protein